MDLVGTPDSVAIEISVDRENTASEYEETLRKVVQHAAHCELPILKWGQEVLDPFVSLAVELVPLAEAIRRLAGKGGWPGVQTSLLTYLRGDVPAGTVWCYREDAAGQHLVGRFPA